MGAWVRPMFRRARALALALVLVLSSQGIGWAAPLAQTVEGVPQGPLYRFSEIGFGSRELTSPDDRQTFSFSMPSGQRLANGASVTLDLVTLVFDNPSIQLSAEELAELDGAITIDINGAIVANVPLTSDLQRQITFPIPESVLAEAPEDGRYNLTLRLLTRTDCEFSGAVRVIIADSSQINLPTTVDPVEPNLTLLPRPIFQRSFLPEQAFIVIPDAPSATELRAAMLTAAGFARQSGNQLNLILRQNSSLTAEEYTQNHLIFVGRAANLPLLTNITLPVPVRDGAFSDPDLDADDGLVQAAGSPWDVTKMALVIGGNSDAGLLKAAQAFALNQLLLAPQRTDLSIITDVTRVTDDSPPVERSFADLGYPSMRRTSSVGISTIFYEFTLPAEQVPADEAFIELVFNHAALISYESSGLTVLVNGNNIGSMRFSDETTMLSRERFLLPRAALRPGRNELVLRISLNPREGCFNLNALDFWLSVWPESRISVPLEPNTESLLRSQSLDAFPGMFTSNPTLDTTAVVVDANDPSSWDAALQVVRAMGVQTNGVPTDFVVMFDDALDEALLETHNLLLLGRPSQLSLIETLGNNLPAPFEPGSDLAIDQVTRVRFRLAEREDVGYVQLLVSPWNDQRVVLTVLGRSPEGLASASAGMTRGDLRARMGGSFAIVIADQVFVGGTRLAVAPAEPDPNAAVPTPNATSTAIITDTLNPITANPNATVPSSGPPLLLALAGSIGFMLVVVGSVVAWGFFRRRKS